MERAVSLKGASVRSVLGYLGLSSAGPKDSSSPAAVCTSRRESPGYFKETYRAVAVAGCGNFATVYRVRELSTGEEYACKVMVPGDIASAEVAALAKLDRHRNIVGLHDHFLAGDRQYIVMEYAGGQELLSVVRDKGSVTEDDAKTVMVQLLSALDSMHSSGVVHRDIKLENVTLYDPDNLESLKVVDFGLAACRSSGLTSVRGTPSWIAPEVMSNQPYDSKCDVWAAGAMLFSLLSGYPPFTAQTDNRSSSGCAQVNSQVKFEDPVWELVEEGAKDCIRTLMNPTPSERPTAAEALALPWLEEEARLYRVRHPVASYDGVPGMSFELPKVRG